MIERLEKAILGLECCIHSILTCNCPPSGRCPFERECWDEEDAPLYVPAMRYAQEVLEEYQEKEREKQHGRNESEGTEGPSGVH